MPRFPGAEHLSAAERKQASQEKLLAFIYQNLRYPALARENGIEGMAVVTFVVEKNGTISAPRLVRDPGGGCGAEAVRLVRLMNERDIRWIPGKHQGEPVHVQFNLPVRFKLN